MFDVVSMKQLLEAGVHFGHQTKRWNPKMKKYIFTERNGIYIIDLQQTMVLLEAAFNYIKDITNQGKTVLFVGTKKQTQDAIRDAAIDCGMPYVNSRWLGGMLTNFKTIHRRIEKLIDLENMESSGEFNNLPKKELQAVKKEIEKLRKNMEGIKSLEKLPDALFIIDPKKEQIAVTEARKIGIPIVAVVDTNCDPDLVDYVIPGNDDAIRAGTLLANVISEAVKAGKELVQKVEETPSEEKNEEVVVEEVK
jgi:small subunit ribosomal protein S2